MTAATSGVPRFSGKRSRFTENTSSTDGSIFSLNDYRTHMGEDGQGRFQKRVHGSTDLYGALKPSYAVVRDQNAGLE